MKSKLSLILFVIFCFFFASTLQAATISRSLSIGMTNEDVRNLQKTLNMRPDTQVSTSGIGSKDQESTYFGILTKNAVIKFQNKYNADILIPAGLSQGNGYVGPLTLKKLNTLIPSSSQNQQIVAPVPLPLIKPTPSLPQVSPQLYSISEINTAPGRTITLTGKGFTPQNNTIYIRRNQ